MTPFCTAIPNKAIKPTAADTLRLIPVANKIKIPPIIAKGTFIKISRAFLIDINAQNSKTKINPKLIGTITAKRFIALC